MIVLFTDFGPAGLYVGQMRAVLHGEAPHIPVIELMSAAPTHEPRAAAYLLAAYAVEFRPPAVFLCVVDPGVGGKRAPVALQVDGRWFVGPDNGLLNVVAGRGREVQWWDITWRPARLSATFHGRDLFAPVAARIARGEQPQGLRCDATRRIDHGWPADHERIIFIDHFGNAITGIRAEMADEHRRLLVKDHALPAARTYSDVPCGEAFWYANANGLVEIAVNCGNASRRLGLNPGDPVSWR